jgi:hypothetical protein
MANHADDQAQHGLMEITGHETAMEFIAAGQVKALAAIAMAVDRLAAAIEAQA